MKGVDDFLSWLVIFLNGDGVLSLLLSPNYEVVLTVVDLQFLRL